ncbi:unnamed protein product [Ectocarpus sp. 12 AP-2014]
MMARERCSLLRRWWALVLLMGMACSSARRSSHVLSQNSPSMRRIMSEWKQVQADGLAMGEGRWSSKGNSSETFRLKPVGNMFEWHFTFLGAKDSPFEGGLYHGSISLPENYPQSGPSVRLLNTNMRFKVGSRICLSASEYHQETWQPSWTVASLVSALVAHMTEAAVEIGAVRGATPSQKRKAAVKSRSFVCAACGCCHDAFPEDRFPIPKGFDKGKKAGAGDDGSAGPRREARVAVGVGEAPAAATRGGLTGRSRLSWTVRLITSKPFLLALALIIASVFLNQPRHS